MRLEGHKFTFFNKTRDIACRKCNKSLKESWVFSRQRKKHYCTSCAKILGFIPKSVIEQQKQLRKQIIAVTN